MRYAVHSAAGQILRIVDCPESQIDGNVRTGELCRAVDSDVRDSTHWIDAGVVTAYPAKPSKFHTFDYASKQWIDLRTPEQIASVLQAEIVKATQNRLDTFSQTRNYDGILSACTYATSSVPAFAAEGQYCVASRDATWAALYVILGEVQAGTRAVPTGFADIEGDLPVLGWPGI